MTKSIIDELETATPSPTETEVARLAARSLACAGERELHLTISETNEVVVLPALAVRLICKLLTAMSEGQAVALMPFDADLSLEDAAELLGVSRLFLMKQLAPDGPIPCRKVGTQRRVLLDDLIAFKKNVMTERLKSLGDLATEAQDFQLGY